MLEKLSKCPLCSATNIQAFKAGSTHLNLDGRFGVSRCDNCNLFSQPGPEKQARQKLSLAK